MKPVINIALGFGFALSTILLASPAKAQTTSQDQSSLADYARKAHKDTGAAKGKPKVFDNDNLPKDDKLSVVGKQPSPDSSQTTPAESGEKPPASADGKAAENKSGAQVKPAAASADEDAKKQAAWKTWQDKLSAQKDQINLATRELDVTQREYQLRAAAMYADAGNRLRNSAQWDKEETNYKQQIADKQKAVDDAKQKLTDMQEEARKDGVPSSMIE